MFTRRTATVTISAPEAACACAITACDEYLPVPTMRRDLNVRPALTKGASGNPQPRFPLSTSFLVVLATAHEIHDLHSIAFADEDVRVRFSLDDVLVMFDRNAPRIDIELVEQRG